MVVSDWAILGAIVPIRERSRFGSYSNRTTPRRKQISLTIRNQPCPSRKWIVNREHSNVVQSHIQHKGAANPKHGRRNMSSGNQSNGLWFYSQFIKHRLSVHPTFSPPFAHFTHTWSHSYTNTLSNEMHSVSWITNPTGHLLCQCGPSKRKKDFDTPHNCLNPDDSTDLSEPAAARVSSASCSKPSSGCLFIICGLRFYGIGYKARLTLISPLTPSGAAAAKPERSSMVAKRLEWTANFILDLLLKVGLSYSQTWLRYRVVGKTWDW